VTGIYQYVLSSRENQAYVQQRKELARQFRERHGSDKDGKSNASAGSGSAGVHQPHDPDR